MSLYNDRPSFSSSRVLVIGLDGATFTVLSPLMDRGLLPNIERVMKEGYHSPLLSTVPPITAPAWTTFITGKNPGKHGIFHFFLPRREAVKEEKAVECFPGSFTFLNSRSIKERTLWEIVSDANKKIGVVNVPMTYPPAAVNGFMITGMLTPSGATNYTFPPELAERLSNYTIDLSPDEKEYSFQADLFLDKLFNMLEQRGETTLRLMREEKWDFLMVVFTGTDRVQHRFWHYLPVEDAGDDSQVSSGLRHRLEDYYRRLDAIIGELIQEAGPEADIIIISDHGFGRAGTKTLYTHALMEKLDLFSDHSAVPLLIRLKHLLQGHFGLNRQSLHRYLGWALPRSWLGRLEWRVKRVEQQAWLATKAHIVKLHDYIGGIVIDTGKRGRGIIESGSEYESLKEELMRKLNGIVDPDTGQKIVTRICTREELYYGQRISESPDIIFFLRPGYYLTGGVGRGNQLIASSSLPPEIQGSHREEGILLMSGPWIRNAIARREIGLADVTATILYLLDVPIPLDMDGTVIDDALEPDLMQMRPIRTVDVSDTEIGRDAESPLWASEQEAQEIEERLRRLGYID